MSTDILRMLACRRKLPAVSNDPYFNNVSLLLHAEESPPVDSSISAHTTSMLNGAIVTSVDPLVGSKSMLFYGTGNTINDQSAINVSNSASLNLSSNDFTIEFKIKLSAFPTTAATPLYFGTSTTSTDNCCWFWIGNTGSVVFYAFVGATEYFVRSIINLSIGVVHSIAVTRTGGFLRLFIDGVLEATAAISGTLTTGGTRSNLIGAFTYLYRYGLNGRMDELRVTNGVARYTGNYTPSSTPFPDY